MHENLHLVQMDVAFLLDKLTFVSIYLPIHHRLAFQLVRRGNIVESVDQSKTRIREAAEQREARPHRLRSTYVLHSHSTL